MVFNFGTFSVETQIAYLRLYSKNDGSYQDKYVDTELLTLNAVYHESCEIREVSNFSRQSQREKVKPMSEL